MPEDKNKKVSEKIDAIIEKFKTDPAKAAEEYANLSAKLGEQGDELGKMRKQLEQVLPAYQQYAQYVQQYQPLVQYWQQYGPQINALVQERNMKGTVRQQAAQAAQNTPNYSILLPEEKRALQEEFAQYFTQNQLTPWTQQLAQNAEQFINQRLAAQQAQWDARQKAYGEVQWRTLERILPPEKIQEARKFQEEALKYTDISKINPMEMATNSLSQQSELASLREERDKLKQEMETVRKQSVTSLGDRSGMFSTPKSDEPIPETREDRFKAAFGAVEKQYGRDGLNALLR